MNNTPFEAWKFSKYVLCKTVQNEQKQSITCNNLLLFSLLLLQQSAIYLLPEKVSQRNGNCNKMYNVENGLLHKQQNPVSRDGNQVEKGWQNDVTVALQPMEQRKPHGSAN